MVQSPSQSDLEILIVEAKWNSCAVEWMWNDAGFLGLHGLARMNPLRWEKCELPTILTAFEHEFQNEDRPVRLRCEASPGNEVVCKSPLSAARSIRDVMSGPSFVARLKQKRSDCGFYPSYWANKNSTESFKDSVLMPVKSLPLFQALLDKTYISVSTRDRPCPAVPPCAQSRKVRGGCHCSRPGGSPGLPVRYHVCQVLRIEDSERWEAYFANRESISKLRVSDKGAAWPCAEPLTSAAMAQQGHHAKEAFAPLDASSNEMYLFHGTNTRLALRIASENVELDLAKSGGGLGPGLYLAESATKADEYASDTVLGDTKPDPYYGGVFAIMVIRVAMGKTCVRDTFFATEAEKNEAMTPILAKKFDSVLADRQKHAGTFREFCVYDKRQTYIEYVVFYRREYAAIYSVRPKGPLSISDMAEGRNFQFQVPSYWCNFHKNPACESFEEEHPVRPRGVQFVQRTIWALSQNTDLRVVKARRLESSSMLCNHVIFKVQRRRQGSLREPGSAFRSLTSEEQWKAVLAASEKCDYSAENLDNDVNEIFLWAVVWVELKPDRTLPSLHECATIVANKSICFFQNPGDAWRSATVQCPSNSAQKFLFLCRVVCGDMGFASHPSSVLGCDSVVRTLDCDGHQCRYLQITTSDHQIYPETMIELTESPSEFACHI